MLNFRFLKRFDLAEKHFKGIYNIKLTKDQENAIKDKEQEQLEIQEFKFQAFRKVLRRQSEILASLFPFTSPRMGPL
jgi:hypothetical protein